MSAPGHISPFGTWDAERMWVLRSLEELKAEQKRQGEQAAATREGQLAEALEDLDALHEKVRKLEGQKLILGIRNWAVTLALSGALAVLWELIQSWIRHH